MELIDKYSLVGADGLFSKRGCTGNCQYCSLWSKEGCRVILEAPTVDAVEVVHGQIIETIENGKMKRVFSCCNTDFTQMTMWITPNYCPNCGANMDGGK